MKKLSFGAPSFAVLASLAVGITIGVGCAASGEGDAESNGSSGNGSGGSGNGSGGSGSVNEAGGETSHVDPNSGCESISKVANVVPPNIMFLVDSSGSMAFDTPARLTHSSFNLANSCSRTALNSNVDSGSPCLVPLLMSNS